MSDVYKIRAVQLDLARQMEKLEFICNFIDMIADSGYNTLFLYLEWRVRTTVFDPGENQGYSKDEIRSIVNYAAARNISIIPGLATLGHAEHVLERAGYLHLGEMREGNTDRFGGKRNVVLCPSLPETRELVEKYVTEVSELFPSEYLHLGGDEAWEIGFCSLCRKKAAAFRDEENIFRDFFTFCRDFTVNKLGKRMMMWDDMFELYTHILPEMPRDIIMVCWQYQDNVKNYLGHFAQMDIEDRAALYAEYGFDWLGGPADFRWGNIDSTNRFLLSCGNAMGVLVTSWVKQDALLFKFFPLLSAAGRLYSNPEVAPEAAFAEAVEYLFNCNDPELAAALMQYSSAIERTPVLPERFLRIHSFYGPDNCRMYSLTTLGKILEKFRGKVRGINAGAILDAIIDDCKLKELHYRTTRAGYQACNRQKHEDFGKLLEELDAVAQHQYQMCRTYRREEDCVWFKENFDQWSSSVKNFAGKIDQQGMLHVRIMNITGYGAEKLQISLKYDGEYHTVLSPSVIKLGDQCLIDCTFSIPDDKVPEAVRIGASGYGGVGVCHVRVENSKGKFAPRQILKQENSVSNGEFILENNICFAFFGSQSAEKLFHDRSLYSKVNFIEIGF